MTRRLLLLVALVTALVVGPAASAQAILNGQPDGDAHPYVGMVTDNQYVCSGALISPTVFITAAHCFDNAGQEVFVTVDPDGFADDSVFVSGSWYPDPDFCIQCGGGLVGFATHDVAVVILDEPVIVSRYAQLPSVGLVDRLSMGQPVEVVG
jgi:hypothetical protein